MHHQLQCSLECEVSLNCSDFEIDCQNHSNEMEFGTSVDSYNIQVSFLMTDVLLFGALNTCRKHAETKTGQNTGCNQCVCPGCIKCCTFINTYTHSND